METPEERERESRETDDTAFERAAERDEDEREDAEEEFRRDAADDEPSQRRKKEEGATRPGTTALDASPKDQTSLPGRGRDAPPPLRR